MVSFLDVMNRLMPCPFMGPKTLPYQKLIYILRLSQTFCPRPKDDLRLVNSVLVTAQNFLEWH